MLVTKKNFHDRETLEQLIAEKKIYFIDSHLVYHCVESDSLIEDFFFIYDTLTDIFKEYWAFEYEYDRLYKRYLIKSIKILFPKVTITNSKGPSHTIKELWVFLLLRVNTEGILYMFKMRGCRTHLSYAEYCSGYMHSHLPRFYLTNKSIIERVNISDFCLGSGEIISYIAEIKNSKTKKEIQRAWTNLFLMINSYVAWESLEGVPYINISSIRVNTNMSREDSYSYQISTKGFKDQYIKEIMFMLLEYLDFDVYISNGFIKIKDNDKLLKSFFNACINSNKTRVLGLKHKNTGQLFNYGFIRKLRDDSVTLSRLSTSDISEEAYISLRDTKYPLKIDFPDTQAKTVKEEDFELYLPDQYRETLINLIEYEHNKTIIRDSVFS